MCISVCALYVDYKDYCHNLYILYKGCVHTHMYKKIQKSGEEEYLKQMFNIG